MIVRRLLENKNQDRFMRGGCYAMALWLANKTGLPIYGLFDDRDGLHHAFVLDTVKNVAYDARGAVPMDRIMIYRGRRSSGTIVRPASRGEVEHLASMVDLVSERTIRAYVRQQPDLSELITKRSGHDGSAMNEGHTPNDGRDERFSRDRLFKAYLDKIGVGANDLIRMSPEDIDGLRKEAERNKHRLTYPYHEPGYVYHGTSRARLSKIKTEGLVPSEKSRWTKTVGVGNWSLGKTFFARSLASAFFYAESASSTRPAVLRTEMDNLIDARDDHLEQEGTSIFITHPISPEKLEIWTGRGWKSLV